MLRWLSRLVLVGTGLVFAAYCALWAVPGLHRLAVETVVTTGHSGLARLISSPGEFRQSLDAWLRTPDLDIVTALTGRRASGSAQVQQISGPEYRGWVLIEPDPAKVHVDVTPTLGRVGEQTSRFGARAHALAAVNGGGFEDAMGNGTGGLPVGLTVSDGHYGEYPEMTGDYVIGLDGRGRLDVGKWTAAQARALGIRDAVSFKPLLVVDGRPQITAGDGGWGIGPRTAIGQRADGAILLVVIDGRQPGSLGATLRQVQDVMLREGAVTAVNLDGGSSSTLWYQGQTLNHPCCSPNGERYIATAWVVMP